MKCKGIYKEELKGKDFYLKFEKCDDFYVLRAVSIHGKPLPQGYLLSLSKRGVFLPTNISKDFGLPLTSDGQLIVEVL